MAERVELSDAPQNLLTDRLDLGLQVGTHHRRRRRPARAWKWRKFDPDAITQTGGTRAPKGDAKDGAQNGPARPRCCPGPPPPRPTSSPFWGIGIQGSPPRFVGGHARIGEPLFVRASKTSSYGRTPVTGLHPASTGDSLVSAADGAGIVLEGRITAYNASPVWRRAIETLTRQPDVPITVDASQLEYVDDVGVALLFDLACRQRSPGAEVRIRGLAPKFASLIQAYDPKDLAQAPKGRAPHRDVRAPRPGNGGPDGLCEPDGRLCRPVRRSLRTRPLAAWRHPLERSARRGDAGRRQCRADRIAGRRPDGSDRRLRDRPRRPAVRRGDLRRRTASASPCCASSGR